MRRIPIDITKPWNFTGRYNSAERRFNATLQISPGLVGSTKGDTLVLNVGTPAKRILFWFGRTYTATRDGGLFRDNVLLGFAYGDMTIFPGTPLATSSQEFLYVAGETKMQKFSSGDAMYPWGITPPTAAPSAAPAGSGSTTINSRYAYAYYSAITDARSNLSPASGLTNSGGQDMTVSGFVASSDVQVTHQIVYRDTDGDGVFIEVAFKINDNNNYTDQAENGDLVGNPSDTNDNAPPPLSAIAILWQKSVWLVDAANPARIWVSVPGKLEGFEVNGIFDVGDGTGEFIHAFGVVGGNLYVFTNNRILLVSGEYPFYRFDAISDLGIVESYAICNNVDRIIFVTTSGPYEFNGATFRQLPDIWTFFDPNSHDDRRYTNVAPKNTVAGADDRHIYVGWQKENNEHVMFQLSNIDQLWTERTPLSAFSSNHSSFNPVAGDYDAFIRTLHTGPRGAFIYNSEQVEFDYSRCLFGEIEYVGGPIEFDVFVDEVSTGVVVLPFVGQRTWATKAINSGQGIAGRRAYFAVRKFGSDESGVGILALNLFTDPLPVPVMIYQSEAVFIDYNNSLPIELFLHIYATQLMSLWIDLIIDNVLIFSTRVDNIQQGFAGPGRFVIPPVAGRSVRLNMAGSAQFCLLNAALGVTPLGENEVRRVVIGGEILQEMGR